MKIAIVYDRVNKWGGAERVLLALNKLFPSAPLYTSVYNPDNATWAKVFPDVIPTFLQKLPFAKDRHDLYPFLMPLAFETHNFSSYDLVISVTSESAKGIITGPDTKHICYMLTPTRYLWSGYEDYFTGDFKKILTKPLVEYLQYWDILASKRPDRIISISNTVKQRVEKYYGLDSDIVYPPVDVQKFKVTVPKFKYTTRGLDWKEYYLVVSRLVQYKKIDLVVEVFNKLGLPLLIVGSGSEEKMLKKAANENIKFLGQVSEKDLTFYYNGAKALIFPQDEDFGLVSVEAQASGIPVIAYKCGGATEIVTSKTGVFFDEQSVESLENAIKVFLNCKFKPEDCIKNAQRFHQQKFSDDFVKLVKRTVQSNL